MSFATLHASTLSDLWASGTTVMAAFRDGSMVVVAITETSDEADAIASTESSLTPEAYKVFIAAERASGF